VDYRLETFCGTSLHKNDAETLQGVNESPGIEVRALLPRRAEGMGARAQGNFPTYAVGWKRCGTLWHPNSQGLDEINVGVEQRISGVAGHSIVDMQTAGQ